MTSVIKKTIFISLCWHAVILSSFNFTFGNRIPKIEVAGVSFLGSILNKGDLFFPKGAPLGKKQIFNTPLKIPDLDETKKEYPLVFKQHLKPLASLPFNQEKLTFLPQASPLLLSQKKVTPAITLHPYLPYHFLVYFKDRHSVHIELMFNIVANIDTANTIMVKRKISSGNLEVDLLSMHYISHYLFIQQASFMPNNWQTVKIDLSAEQ